MDFAPDQDEEFRPPLALRVAKRALVLTAVATRALAEQLEIADADKKLELESFATWVKQLNIDEEMEAQEREFVYSKPGAARQDVINGSWRVEGLAILAWALKLLEKPAYDQQVNSDLLFTSIHSHLETLVSSPVLRSLDELGEYAEQIFALHWRLVDFSIDPKPLNFVWLAREASFGPLDISAFELIDDDLALDGERIDQVDPNELGTIEGMVSERHQAINWLLGQAPIYSEVPVDT